MQLAKLQLNNLSSKFTNKIRKNQKHSIRTRFSLAIALAISARCSEAWACSLESSSICCRSMISFDFSSGLIAEYGLSNGSGVVSQSRSRDKTTLHCYRYNHEPCIGIPLVKQVVWHIVLFTVCLYRYSPEALLRPYSRHRIFQNLSHCTYFSS